MGEDGSIYNVTSKQRKKRGKRKKCHVFLRLWDGSGPQRRKGIEDVTGRFLTLSEFRRVRDFYQFRQKFGNRYTAVKKTHFAGPV